MLSLSTCTYLPIFIPLVLTKPLAPVADQSLQWPGNTTALASNQLLLPSPNLSVGNGVKVVCDGAAYGSNLDIEDCINGVEYIWTGPAELPFAYRHTPFQKEFAIPLPWRSLGGKRPSLLREFWFNLYIW